MGDERKRKRMESNRESARRSRVKKQQQLQQVISDIDHFKRQNIIIASKIEETRQRYSVVETEINSVTEQKMDLEKRLSQLNSIIEKTESRIQPIWKVDSWSDFSMMVNCGDSGNGDWLEGNLGINDFELSICPWRLTTTSRG